MKKIIAVLLSLAVIFTFAACDNSTTANPYFGQQVQRVVLESAPDYLVGESIVPADVKVIVEYDNGSVTLTGEDVGMHRTTGGFIVSETDATTGYIEFNVNYGSDNPFLTENPAVKKWTIKVPVYAIDEVEIDATNGVKTVESTATTVSAEGLAYTLVYTKGTAEVERTATAADLLGLDISVVPSVSIGSAELGDKVPVSVTATQGTNNLDSSVSPVWTVEVIADQSKVIKDVSIARDETEDVFNFDSVEGATGSVSKNKVADLPWVLTITLGNGDTIKLEGKGEKSAVNEFASTDGVASVTVDFLKFTNSNTTLKDANTTSFDTYIEVKLAADDKAFVKQTTYSVGSYTADYPKVIRVALADNTKKFYEGTKLDKEMFNFYCKTMASGVSYADTATKSVNPSDITLETTSIDWGTAANTKLDVEFSWSGAERNETVTFTGGEDLITVSEKSAEGEA